MDVCLYGRCHSSYSRVSDSKECKMPISCLPFVSRRPQTSFAANRQASSPPPRIHSASARIAMTTQRTQISMAGFFDWSREEFDDLSIPNMYRKLAIVQTNKYNKSKSWCSDGLQLNSGRMFVRDKADLTKGEREIIAGIYKNRGDLIGKSDFVTQVRSHKDAWLVGKHTPKRGSINNKWSVKIPNHLLSKAEDQRDLSYTACHFCVSCIRDEERCNEEHSNNWKRIGSQAPPSSPNNSPKTHRKQQLQEKKCANEGRMELGKTFIDSANGAKKKVYVDVFLPTFETTLQEDMSTFPLNDEPKNETKTKSI